MRQFFRIVGKGVKGRESYFTENPVSFDLGGGLRFEALVSRHPAGKGEAKPSSLQGSDDGGSAHTGGADTEPLPEAATSGENEGGLGG